MSDVRLNILETERTIHGTIHGTEIDYVVAALSACPTTIEELQNAMARFCKPLLGPKPFALFEPGTNEEPHEAGISFVDLAARVVATEAAYSNPQTKGCVCYHDGTKLTDIKVAYYVPDDWLLLNSVAEYQCIRDLRRAHFAASPPLDVRTVLYNAVTDFIVSECFAARDAKMKDPVVEIHARWLMTPRDDLRGQSPRIVMLQQREFIEADLQSREDQWGILGEPAPCLDETSVAYRFGGFGTHEIIVYYDLVRFLISRCWKHINKKRSISVAREVARLRQLQSEWLARPEEDFENKSAAYVIECERKRLPLAGTPEDDWFDDNCPLCRAMAEHPRPGFWHFDGSNMDDDFAFSLFSTREEWEELQSFRNEIDRDLERGMAQRKKELFDEAGFSAGDHTRIH